MSAKSELRLKTESSKRILPIPDYVFEAILEERQKYEKNSQRRINDQNTPFYDGDFFAVLHMEGLGVKIFIGLIIKSYFKDWSYLISGGMICGVHIVRYY